MTYGEKISRLRKSKGMTQEELGKVLNVTYQAVSKWERCESQPDFETMSLIAKYFQVPLSYFEDGGETQKPDDGQNSFNNIAGTCTVCGKMLKDDEVNTYSPKIICKACAERIDGKNKRAKAAEEATAKRQREYAA